MKDLTSISKFLALVLRHKPEEAGLMMSHNGYVSVDYLVQAFDKKYHGFTKEMLDEIVRTDNKQRYSYNEDETLIRANQGHSVRVDGGLKEQTPPDILYHGTATKYTSMIDETGLLPKSRIHVHLSKDLETASTVGCRHGELVIYEVDAKKMHEDGLKFYQSVNGVWLTDKVPVAYLKKLELNKTV